MPRKKTKARRRRRFRKRRTNNIINRSIAQPIAEVYTCKMVYNTMVNFTGLTTKNNIFRGNGAWDPDATGTGDRPYGWDGLDALYQRYRCFGSKIRVIPSNQQLVGTSLCVYPHTDSVAESDYGDAISTARSKSTFVVNYARASTVRNYATTAEIMGVNKDRVRDDDLFASANNNVPSQQWYWHVRADTADFSTNVALTAQVQITYYMQWFMPYSLNQN